MTIKCFIVFLVFITSQLIICQENDDKTEVSIVETEILKDIPISNEIGKLCLLNVTSASFYHT